MNYLESNHYDVAIVGAGPAGLFAAYELTRLSDNLKVVVLDKGKSQEARNAGREPHNTEKGSANDLISGGGGAGLFSDGKMVLNLDAGGHLNDYLCESEKSEILSLIEEVIRRFTDKFMYKSTSKQEIERFRQTLTNFGLGFSYSKILHLGSCNAYKFNNTFINYLNKRMEFRFDAEVTNIRRCGESWSLTLKEAEVNDTVKAKIVVLAVGKDGSRRLASLAKSLGATYGENGCWMGVRVEVPNKIISRLLDVSPDPKIFAYLDDTTTKKIKTHCFCRNGQVLFLSYYGFPLLGGHTLYIETDDRFDEDTFTNTNFAILYKDFKHPYHWNDAIRYMTRVNQKTSGKLLVQRLGNFLENASTNEESLSVNAIKPSNKKAIAGDIASVMPCELRDALLVFLHRLNKVAPGVCENDTLLYAPAIEWWMERIDVNKNMEVSNVPDLFAIGDGAGLTQGIIQSAATGILAARGIHSKIGMEYAMVRGTK